MGYTCVPHHGELLLDCYPSSAESLANPGLIGNEGGT